MERVVIAALEFNLIAKKNGWKEEEKKDMKKLEEEIERLKRERDEALEEAKKANEKVEIERREKEEALREKERIIKENEEEKEKVAEEKKEKEELKKNLEKEKQQSIYLQENIMKNLLPTNTDSVSVFFSENNRIKKEGSKIIHNGYYGSESCVFDYEMKKVCLL